MADHDERELERRAAAGDAEAAASLEAARARRGAGALAIISDVHANLEALTAVFTDIETRGIREVICLGGMASYGCNPVEVVDLLRERATVCLKGSYDEALFSGTYGLHKRVEDSLNWARDKLRPGFFGGRAARKRWSWLAGLPTRHERPGLLAVHGHPDDGLWGHIPFAHGDMTEDVGVGSHLDSVERLVFGGLLCLPFAVDERGLHRSAKHLGGRLELAPGKYAICPGSVGQPRDRDTRAGYAVLFEDVVTWHRVEYDLERQVSRLEGSDVPHREIFGARLREGI